MQSNLSKTLKALPIVAVSALVVGPMSMFAPSVFAETNTKTNTPTTTNSDSNAALTARLEANKKIAENEIDRRVTALNNLINVVQARKRLTDAQKSQFVTNIQNEINTLTALKTKIESDTDLDTLKADAKSVTDAYRVFAVYMPQVRIEEAVDIVNSAADKVSDVATKLNARIVTQQGKGKDVTALMSDYNDMVAKIADARANASSAEAIAEALTPDGYPGNKTQIEAARADIKNAIADLKAARQDAAKIVSGLKGLGEKPVSSPV